MKKFSLIATTVASLMLLTGCGEEKKAALKLYNDYVTAINTADYETAFELTDAANNPYMTVDLFEESLDTIGATYSTAEKAKKADTSWEFAVGDFKVNYSIVDNKLVIPEVCTSVEVYVPTGSTCTYNGVLLTSDLITESDDLETTYTIPNAPVGIGVLHIDTALFGSSEREVDPEIGDYNDFELSEEMTTEVGGLIVNEINSLNAALETGDAAQFKAALSKFTSDTQEQQKLSDDLYINRKLSEPFTSFRGVNYTINDISADFTTSTSIDVSIGFTATWTIGENKTGTMETSGDFSVDRTEGGWTVTSINKWDFMFLNAIGGEES